MGLRYREPEFRDIVSLLGDHLITRSIKDVPEILVHFSVLLNGLCRKNHVFWDREKHRKLDVILIVPQVDGRLEMVSLLIIGGQCDVEQLDIVMDTPL